MNIKLRFTVSVVLAIFCVLILGVGVETAPVAHAAAEHATAAQPAKHYNSPQWFAPDGKSHHFKYDIPCTEQAKAEGKQCWVMITVTATRNNTPVPAPQGAAQYTRAFLPLDWTNVTVTNDFKTCTGYFGTCGDYTDAGLQSNFSYNGFGVQVIWNHQYCSAYGWACQYPLAGVAVINTGDQFHDIYFDYGPQLFNSTHNGNQQTKWVDTEVDKYGDTSFQNSCFGALC